MSIRPRPTRLQKRWSGRLRTAGALLLLAGVVAIADHLLFLSRPAAEDAVDPVHFAGPGFWAAATVLLVAGSVFFWLGRRWQ